MNPASKTLYHASRLLYVYLGAPYPTRVEVDIELGPVIDQATALATGELVRLARQGSSTWEQEV